MDKKNKFPLFIIFSLVAVLVAIFLMQGDGGIAVLYPKGWVGLQQRDLIMKVSWIMLLVVIPVIVFTLYFGWKYREGNREAKYQPDWDQSYLLEFIWWLIPFAIIVLFSIWTWSATHELDPYKPLKSDRKPLRIQVIALDWKWLFIYPEQQIAAVNWVQFPENTPLEFEITSDAPMNSFWIPELGGQIYAMAGMKTKLSLIANQIGTYRGVSANISGSGFAGMTFSAKASSEQDFDDWVSGVQQSANLLDAEEYSKLMQQSSYHPVVYYALREGDLFNQVVMKYMMPMGKQ